MQNLANDTNSIENAITEGKFKYISARALFYGFIFTFGVNLFSPIYGDNLLKTILVFTLHLIIYTLIGVLFAYGDWKVRNVSINSKKT